ncbi:hypothetical protein Adt_35200 [Abeliophyllum distichum]|uniref:Uncharacterized protein n=1 Tax=Abeliophyllum distichum TaxID=126358 RepID=A0ABD1QF04_9LAMI
MNLVRGFVLAKELFGIVESFDAKEAKSKKLSKNLKAMSLEKAQLESEKRALQLVVTKEADMRAKYEIELKAAKECLKQARDQKRAAEVFHKRAEKAQKLAEDRTLMAKTALATANSSLEAIVAEKEKSLAAAKQELERVRAEQAEAEAEVKAVEAYQDAFVDTPEYQDLAQRLMTVGGEQLVERIMETHPEWDISFLRQALTEVPASEAILGDKCDGAEDQTTPLVVEEGLQCADP